MKTELEQPKSEVAKKEKTFIDFLKEQLKKESATLPANVNIDRFVANCQAVMCDRKKNTIEWQQYMKTPQQRNEIIQALLKGARCDLEYGTEFYLQEWKDKNDNYNKHIEMSFDYKGFLKMITLFAVKHIRRIVVEVVYEGDLFEVNTLAEPPIKHSPQFKSKEDKDIQFAYMAWQYEYGEYGGWEYEVMTREDLDQVQKCSKTDNIWKQWYKEMAKKSVVRRARKRIPLTWKNNFEAEKIWNEQIEQETDFSKLDKPQEKHEVIDVDCEVQNG